MMTPRAGKSVTAIILAATTLTALAGCDHADVTDGPSMTCDGDGVVECAVTMRDGRRVHCIVMQSNAYRSGISCDWAHADGADKQDGGGQ